MRRITLFLLFISFSSITSAQGIGIDTLFIIPENPTPHDAVKIVIRVASANQGGRIGMGFEIINQNIINVTGCYWNGFLTQPDLYSDTLNIGPLIADNYTIHLTVIKSSSTDSCVLQQSISQTDSFVVSLSNNIANVTFENAVSIYPNPTSSLLTIETAPDSYRDPSGFYQLQDITGKQLLNGTITSTKFNLDISAFSNGIYLLSIFDGEQQTHYKIIKE